MTNIDSLWYRLGVYFRCNFAAGNWWVRTPLLLVGFSYRARLDELYDVKVTGWRFNCLPRYWNLRLEEGMFLYRYTFDFRKVDQQ